MKTPFIVRPNPFSEVLILKFEGFNAQVVPEAQLYSAQGLLYNVEVEQIHPNTAHMDTRHLPAGAYLLVVRYGDKHYFIPLIKAER